MNEQRETIVWHKWPEVKPEKDGYYLIELDGYIVVKSYWSSGQWDIAEDLGNFGACLTGWAELPKGVEK